MTTADRSLRLQMIHSEIRNAKTRFGRLKAIGAGIILVAIGTVRLIGGVQVVTHWTGPPMFSWGFSRRERFAFCRL
jgi:hypothetical protein